MAVNVPLLRDFASTSNDDALRNRAMEAADEIERLRRERDHYRQELDGVLKMIGDSGERD